MISVIDDPREIFAIREYTHQDIPQMLLIWNEVVEAANAFPQTDLLSEQEATTFFRSQSFTGVAEADGRVVGLYILHPNNVGRCAHVANASYAVASAARGHGIGRKLVEHSLSKLLECGFTGLQFNAVVVSNTGAIALYEDLGFQRIGIIPGGYKNGQGVLEDMIIFYKQAE